MDREDLLLKKTKKINSLLWLFEPLEGDSGFICQKFFSFDAAYMDGLLYLAVADGKEPWSGLMVCTWHDCHASLQKDFPVLKPLRVLGKWLYLSHRHPEFEAVGPDIVQLAAKRDARAGIEPQARKRRSRKAKG